MNNYKSNARFAGVMFLVAMIASLSGGLLLQEIIDKADFMSNTLDSKLAIFIGVKLELINAFAVIGIVAALWAPLKPRGAIRVGYLGVRIIEAAICAFAAFIPITMLTFAKQGGDTIIVVDALRTIRGDLVSYAIPIFFGMGAILLYIMLWSTKLVPRYISVWGLIASIAIMANMFVQVGTFKAVLALPIILNEIYLGIYLIVKGFRKEG